MPNNLPPNWAWVKLGDVIGKDGLFVDGDWVESKDQDPNGEVRLIQLADIGEIEFRNKSDRYLTHSKALELKCTFIKYGDLLVARMPDPLGRTCIFQLKGDDKYVTVVDVAIIRVEKKIVDKKFLCYIVNAPQSRNKISELQSGSTRKRISRKNLGSIHFPLPPLPEQKKIVEKIEELFSGLDSGVASLKKAKEQIRLYRQSVLASAFSGRLHKDSSDYMISRIKEKNKSGKSLNPENPQILVNHGSDNLPDGWKWVKLGEVLEVKDGTHDTPKYHDKGIPFITQKNIKNGEFVFNNYNLISEEDHQKFYKRSNVAFNDIIISMIGANRGMSTIVKTKETFSIKNVGLVKTDESKFLAKYLAYFFKSEIGQSSILSQSKGGAQQFIGLTELRNWSVPLPSRIQQTQIVEEIEKRFSEADNLEKAIDESLAKSETLRQSILKQAFEGRLV